ncbi:MAG TPA: zinc ribbon domain-containing protein [Gemmatimonadales bacterium]|nr:zinc ribbon domain-containing protein [Gemmatimonadales bacterium]
MSAPQSPTCPACGAAASGNFCSSCGGSLAARKCTACGSELSTHARFCHRCGQPAVAWAGAPAAGAPPVRGTGPGAGRSDRAIWLAAGAVIALAIGGIVLKVERGTAPAPSPDMANVGSQSAAPFAPFANGGAPENGSAGGSAAGVPVGPAPDISRMSPRERFDRLFNRIMSAAEQGDTVTVTRFTPMALGAYGQLDTVNTDARYHAAVLYTQAGDFPAALALADTILATQPGHLFGYMVRGTVAGLSGDARARDAALKGFKEHYAPEMKAGRPEYADHKPAIEAFRQEAVNGR